MKTKKKNGRFEIIADAADRGRHAVIGSYTPDRLTQIFQSANTGDVKDLCLCGREILERNFDLIGAMEQRINALSGCSYDIQPGDDTPKAREAAKKFAAALKYAGQFNQYDTFYDFCCNCMSAVVMPFAATEIIWGAGGKLEGFRSIEAHNFNLRNGYVPQLVTDEFPDGMPLEMQENKIIFHYSGRKNDPARAGKIRVLAWLHCFQNYPIKDLFSFVERFGMPFVVAKVDRDTWENERQILHSLIRSFGPNGGGVFTKSTELQLLNAANTGGDNVYFHVLNFTREAIYRLIVGQTASSSDSSGMSNGDAQTAVRQDILESDARALESTVFSKIARPWTLFNYGADVAIPEIHFQVEVPEDQLHLANIINVLSQAGFKADEHELSERFGLKLKYEVPAAPAPASFGMYSNEDEDAAHNLNLKQKYDAMGVAIRAGLLTATPDIEIQTRNELGLPEMSDDVKKSWEATGGMRQPITLKSAESEAVNDALKIDQNAMSAENPEEKNAKKIYGKCAEKFALLENIDDPEEFKNKLDDLINSPDIDEKSFAKMVEIELLEGYLEGLKNKR